LRSKRGIWFKPSSYKLHIEVEYEIAGLRNVDTIEYAFQIKASLGSIILGAIIGGIGGWLANRGEQLKNFDLADWISLGISLVLAAMAVVLFARKKDVQPLIAIEDFWGGIAIGFLVAYSGPQLLKNLLTTSAAPTQ
jgi:NhaP-type Na+/H+ or K+/H+ antiporter